MDEVQIGRVLVNQGRVDRGRLTDEWTDPLIEVLRKKCLNSSVIPSTSTTHRERERIGGQGESVGECQGE